MNGKRVINVTFPNAYNNKVSVIKTIREIQYMVLKEAKDMSESQQEQTLYVDNGISEDRLAALISVLQNDGCIIGNHVYHLLKELRGLAADALKIGEDELANEILQLVLAEKLRRQTNQNI